MIAYMEAMSTRAQHDGELDSSEQETERGHDAWVRTKVERGLKQSRDRATMISVDRVWRALGLAR